MSKAIAPLCVLLCSGFSACADTLDTTAAAPALATGKPALCARPADDAVQGVFCADPPPQIDSLHALQQRFGMVFDASEYGPVDEPAVLPAYLDYPQRSLLMLNSSTALSGRLVSTVNPRAIVLTPEATMAFNRGVQQVELMSHDRQSGRLNMYLLRFEQACNARPQGCSPGDLFTPRIESNWTRLRIEDDEELKNTAADCRQCHQRAREQPILLMRELDGPWTHFFMPDRGPAQDVVTQPDVEPVPEPDGSDLVSAYHRAKGDEPYGNLPWAAIRSTIGLTLQMAVNLPQPLVFDGGKILNERWPWTRESGFAAAPVASETWYREYEAFKRGEHLALPHYEVFVSDPQKLERLTDSYRAFVAGELAGDDLPDLGDIYPDDPQLRAEIGLQTEPGASPAQTLIQACGACHNDVLDQSLSRARFNIDLGRLSRAALDAAIARISLPPEHPSHMPPSDFRQLDPGAVAPLIDFLRRDTLPQADAELLRRAAELGMAVDTVKAPSGLGIPRE